MSNEADLTFSQLEQLGREAVKNAIYPTSKQRGSFVSGLWMFKHNPAGDGMESIVIEALTDSISQMQSMRAVGRRELPKFAPEFTVIASQATGVMPRSHELSAKSLADQPGAIRKALSGDKDFATMECYAFTVEDGKKTLSLVQMFSRDDEGKVKLIGRLIRTDANPIASMRREDGSRGDEVVSMPSASPWTSLTEEDNELLENDIVTTESLGTVGALNHGKGITANMLFGAQAEKLERMKLKHKEKKAAAEGPDAGPDGNKEKEDSDESEA